MAGVETEADRQAGKVARQIADGLQLFEAAAERRAAAGGVFEKHRQLKRAQTRGGIAQAKSHGGDAFLYGLAAITAGMHYQILGADSHGALDLSAKAVNGLGANHR